MKKYKIVFSKEAREDFKNIVSYIKYELKEPNIAIKFLTLIKEKIVEIASNPTMYSIIDDDFIKRLELRKAIVGNYIIFYRIADDVSKVQIARILHGKRNWKNILK